MVPDRLKNESAGLRQRYQRSLDSFVYRARRVEAHSLARDRSALQSLANKSMSIECHADGRVYITVALPPEEQVESLAVRVRPFILHDDPVCGVTVMTAIGFLMQGAPHELHAEVRRQRKSWKSVDDKYCGIRGYGVQVADLKTGESATLSDNVLAFAWIYGDTVHAKDRPLSETRLFGVSARYEAAVPLVAQLAVRAINTLTLIRHAHTQGYLEIDAKSLTDAAVVTETVVRKEGRVFTAPLGTPPPDSINDPFGEGWRELKRNGGPAE